jgi:hypothetical protein
MMLSLLSFVDAVIVVVIYFWNQYDMLLFVQVPPIILLLTHSPLVKEYNLSSLVDISSGAGMVKEGVGEFTILSVSD